METISAKEFKANCSKILDRVAAGEILALTIIKDGKPAAIIGPPTKSTATQSGAIERK
jgi:antitoxin (DNA-binding transcriptional repressor) of toxin-antitoxin stability system